jgi:hypothetical protein
VAGRAPLMAGVTVTSGVSVAAIGGPGGGDR